MNGVVGFIGLGTMGRPMAANLIGVCHRLLVCDHHQENMDALRAKGAEMELDCARMAREADVIFLSLPAPRQVREVVQGPDGLLAHGHAGQYIIDTSTVDTTTSRELADEAAGRGIVYIDAPVSGGGHNAAAGTLTFMLGAREEELTPVLPLIRAMGKTLHYMGRRGGGSAIKIINNFMCFAIQIVNAEALVMADHVGMTFDEFFAVVDTSSGSNTGLRAKREKLRRDDIEAAFTVDLVIKDLELAVQICRDCGIPNFTLNFALQWYRMAQYNGYAKKDSTSVIRLIRGLDQPKI